MLQIKLARELGYTLCEILERVTLDELIIWSGFFALEADEIERQARKRF
jgi:hypothetical protein